MEDKELIRADFDKIALIKDKEWDHNRHYHKYLLKHLDNNIELSIDIGCGKGEFASQLIEKSNKVIGIDLSDEMIKMARNVNTSEKIDYIAADVMEMELENDKYDCIASIATAHHLPMRELMLKAKTALKQHGTFLILDLYYAGNLLDKLIEGLAVPCNIIMMLAIEGRLRPSKEEIDAWREHGKHDRYLTLKEVKELCNEIMPGAKVKRHFYWRYSIVWKKR